MTFELELSRILRMKLAGEEHMFLTQKIMKKREIKRL